LQLQLQLQQLQLLLAGMPCCSCNSCNCCWQPCLPTVAAAAGRLQQVAACQLLQLQLQLQLLLRAIGSVCTFELLKQVRNLVLKPHLCRPTACHRKCQCRKGPAARSHLSTRYKLLAVHSGLHGVQRHGNCCWSPSLNKISQESEKKNRKEKKKIEALRCYELIARLFRGFGSGAHSNVGLMHARLGLMHARLGLMHTRQEER
jgi:hypothetical protein